MFCFVIKNLLLIPFLTHLLLLCVVGVDPPVSLLLVRDIDYNGIQGGSRNFASSLFNQIMPDIQKNLTTMFRVSIPFGHEFTMKAFKIYPTWSFQSTRGNYKPIFNITDYIKLNATFNIKIYRSCRLFSTFFKTNNSKTNVSFEDAVKDWKDEIGSISMPCPSYSTGIGGGFNTNREEHLLFQKNNVLFTVTKTIDLWWSSVYEISLFMTTSLNSNDGFRVDTTNITHCIQQMYEFYVQQNERVNWDASSILEQQQILLEPNSFWIKVEIVSPFFVYLDQVTQAKNLQNASIRKTDDYLLTSTIRLPSWNANLESIKYYENIPGSIDYSYASVTKLDIDTSSSLSSTTCFLPFFFSPNYRDVFSQMVSSYDENNFFRLGWMAPEALSTYNKLVYSNKNGFYECFMNNSTSALYNTPLKGMFSFIDDTAVTWPIISQKMYVQHTTYIPLIQTGKIVHQSWISYDGTTCFLISKDPSNPLNNSVIVNDTIQNLIPQPNAMSSTTPTSPISRYPSPTPSLATINENSTNPSPSDQGHMELISNDTVLEYYNEWLKSQTTPVIVDSNAPQPSPYEIDFDNNSTEEPLYLSPSPSPEPSNIGLLDSFIEQNKLTIEYLLAFMTVTIIVLVIILLVILFRRLKRCQREPNNVLKQDGDIIYFSEYDNENDYGINERSLNTKKTNHTNQHTSKRISKICRKASSFLCGCIKRLKCERDPSFFRNIEELPELIPSDKKMSKVLSRSNNNTGRDNGQSDGSYHLTLDPLSDDPKDEYEDGFELVPKKMNPVRTLADKEDSSSKDLHTNRKEKEKNDNKDDYKAYIIQEEYSETDNEEESDG